MKNVTLNGYRYLIVTGDQLSKIADNKIFDLYELDLETNEARKIETTWDVITVKKSGGIIAIQVGFL